MVLLLCGIIHSLSTEWTFRNFLSFACIINSIRRTATCRLDETTAHLKLRNSLVCQTRFLYRCEEPNGDKKLRVHFDKFAIPEFHISLMLLHLTTIEKQHLVNNICSRFCQLFFAPFVCYSSIANCCVLWKCANVNIFTIFAKWQIVFLFLIILLLLLVEFDFDRMRVAQHVLTMSPSFRNAEKIEHKQRHSSSNTFCLRK